MRWESDGWTEQDWAGLDAAADDLRAIAAEFAETIGCGGGSFGPDAVRGFAARLRATLSKLEGIEGKYI